MHAGLYGLLVATLLRKMKHFTGQYGFTGSKIGEHAFPTPRKSCAMKNNHQTIIVGIVQEVLIKLHGHLLVATKKINLYSLNSNTLHPFHFGSAYRTQMHVTMRTLRGIVPVTVGIVPQKQSNVFGGCIGRQFFYFIPTNLGIPKSIRSEEHTSELQSRPHLVCRLLLEKKKNVD